MFRRILLFGFGTMASSMLEGWLASGLKPGQFTAYNPRPKPVPGGVSFTAEMPKGDFDAIVLGVKPQKLGKSRARWSRCSAQTRCSSRSSPVSSLPRWRRAFPVREESCG